MDNSPATKKYWFKDDPVSTIYANAVTASIPYGERFLILTILSNIPKIKNPELKKKAIQFVREEIKHSREHLRFFRKTVKPFYPKLSVKKQFFYKLSQITGFAVGNKIRLATIAAVEHLTATTGHLYLTDPKLFDGANKELIAIWEWHFSEEIGHKEVAFEVLQDIGCGYFTRVLGFILATFFLLVGFFSPFLHMARYDGLHKSLNFYLQTFRFFWINPGVMRRIAFPYIRYLKPFFHPSL